MTVTYGFYDSLTNDRRYNAMQFSSLFDSRWSWSILNPRCPPARGPSRTTASGLQATRSHFLHISSSALADETMGTSAVSPWSLIAGSVNGSPPPEIMTSVRASIAALTVSWYPPAMATMILMPETPPCAFARDTSS